MQAVILAGGKGTRLKPYTAVLPKPLMPIDDKPVLEIILMQLKQHGFTEFVFTVGYLAELLEAYFGDGSRWKVKIRYSRENKPLGTAGPLTIVDKLAPQFLVMNGDILCDLDYRDFIRSHTHSGQDITICVYDKKVKIDLGVLEYEQNELTDYIEKPEYKFKVSMGIYGVNRQMVKRMPRGVYYDFPNLIKDMLQANGKINTYHFNGKWYDIGKVEDHQAAQDEYVANSKLFMINKRREGR